ncbi:TPA: hypothetical protein ACXJGC_001559 [Burkholderia cenocepacia]|uniref:Uncharacterized protein n=1 Tax=Burkholderia latens TaxID=488446 RepID=A0A6H9T5H5_9BURK|nr:MULTISPECIES: hypothetical protein [Burkholderia]KAB0644550.1 hypothetical protein F7R21_01750 [Burkholderia latens]MBJ9926849.1 hypothetical protein [Burkholderia cenocepacia]UJH78737.1 hypothetical protein L0U95_36745 [Burkholderia cenocepacia]
MANQNSEDSMGKSNRRLLTGNNASADIGIQLKSENSLYRVFGCADMSGGEDGAVPRGCVEHLIGHRQWNVVRRYLKQNRIPYKWRPIVLGAEFESRNGASW